MASTVEVVPDNIFMEVAFVAAKHLSHEFANELERLAYEYNEGFALQVSIKREREVWYKMCKIIKEQEDKDRIKSPYGDGVVVAYSGAYITEENLLGLQRSCEDCATNYIKKEYRFRLIDPEDRDVPLAMLGLNKSTMKELRELGAISMGDLDDISQSDDKYPFTDRSKQKYIDEINKIGGTNFNSFYLEYLNKKGESVESIEYNHRPKTVEVKEIGYQGLYLSQTAYNDIDAKLAMREITKKRRSEKCVK